ncbi:hypothetical protein J7E29_00020 [Streptomyces sp. ISL-90]|nr:hypothetical protein [Streptomyces sp. ISL-90]
MCIIGGKGSRVASDARTRDREILPRDSADLQSTEQLTLTSPGVGIRVAAGIILLFGQPVNRTASLRLDAIRATADGELEIRFASDWVPIPEPFAILLDLWIDTRTNLQTAAHRDSPWLFPGGMPGEHLAAGTVSTLLARHGISPRAAREAAWQELVHDIPPALLATAFGITTQSAEAYSRTAGARYARYAALDR